MTKPALLADGTQIRYRGQFGEKFVSIDLTEDDLDAIEFIHQALAGESDAAISAAVQLYLVRVAHPELLN
jgi:hypothetical protein